MLQRVGTCSLCGGDVMGVRGAWWSVLPPPPDECSSCGAVARRDIIDMVPRPRFGGPGTNTTWTTSTDIRITYE